MLPAFKRGGGNTQQQQPSAPPPYQPPPGAPQQQQPAAAQPAYGQQQPQVAQVARPMGAQPVVAQAVPYNPGAVQQSVVYDARTGQYVSNAKPMTMQPQPAGAPVVGQPTMVVVQQTAPPRPPNYMCTSCLTFFFCCWPISLVAWIYSCMVDSAYDSGNFQQAVQHSETARKLNLASVVGAIIVVIIAAAAGG